MQVNSHQETSDTKPVNMDANIDFGIGEKDPRIAILKHQMVASTVTKPKSISGNMTNSGLF